MTQTMSQPAQEKQELALFRACYRIERKGVVGAPILMLQLLVDPQSKHVSGFGRISQATNPPLEFTTQLNGEFRVISVKNLRLIIVTANGHAPAHMAMLGAKESIMQPNFELLMALGDGWQQPGTAEYEYRISPESPHWQIVSDVEANPISCDAG